MHLVMRWRQHEPEILEVLHPPRRCVLMRPFVKLIGRKNPEAKAGEDRCHHHSRWSRLEQVDGRCERRQADKSAGAVGLDEIVAGDGHRIDMVLPKSPNDGIPDHRPRGPAPCVGRPMNEPAHEIGDEEGRDETHEREHDVSWLAEGAGDQDQCVTRQRKKDRDGHALNRSLRR